MTAPYRIDVHHHILPPKYLAEERERILAVASWLPPEIWTPARALEEMDRNSIVTSVASISAPGTWFGSIEQGRRIARICNEYMAELKRNHPGCFGGFAALPLPDCDGSLREIEHALDVLNLEGIGLMTNYAGKYPGDAAFSPVFDELNRREAVVFFHPTSPSCCPAIPDLRDSSLEYPTDTARAILSLLFSGTLSRCPSIRFVFSHGGGTLPLLWDRVIDSISRPAYEHVRRRFDGDVRSHLRRLHYDTAIVRSMEALALVMSMIPVSQILLGTDFPFQSPNNAIESLAKYRMSPQDALAIERDNALRVIRKLAKTSIT